MSRPYGLHSRLIAILIEPNFTGMINRHFLGFPTGDLVPTSCQSPRPGCAGGRSRSGATRRSLLAAPTDGGPPPVRLYRDWECQCTGGSDSSMGSAHGGRHSRYYLSAGIAEAGVCTACSGVVAISYLVMAEGRKPISSTPWSWSSVKCGNQVGSQI